MADINHTGRARIEDRTEGDGISYRGVGWAMATLAIVTLVCYALVVGLFKFWESRSMAGDTPRAPLAAAPVQPSIEGGRVLGGPSAVPSLLVGEPINLQKFRAEEERLLNTYGWVDQNAGVVRLPIDRAKELLLVRGLPIRGEAKPAEAKHGEVK